MDVLFIQIYQLNLPKQNNTIKFPIVGSFRGSIIMINQPYVPIAKSATMIQWIITTS